MAPFVVIAAVIQECLGQWRIEGGRRPRTSSRGKAPGNEESSRVAPWSSFQRGHGRQLKGAYPCHHGAPDHGLVIPANAGIQEVPGKSGFPPSRERRYEGSLAPSVASTIAIVLRLTPMREGGNPGSKALSCHPSGALLMLGKRVAW